MNLGDRIQRARKQAGLTQKELAERVGISQTAVHKLECGRSRSSRKTVTIALTCNVDPVWLETGIESGAMNAQQPDMSGHEGGAMPRIGEVRRAYRSQTPPTGQVSPQGGARIEIPLLSWKEAGNSLGAAYAEIASGWISLGSRSNAKTFAMKISGDSMAPEFSEGDFIIVDASIPAENNSHVVVRLSGEESVTFKQLIMDGGRKYLKPLNSRYPITEIDNRAIICGVVVAKYKEY